MKEKLGCKERQENSADVAPTTLANVEGGKPQYKQEKRRHIQERQETGVHMAATTSANAEGGVPQYTRV